MRKTSAKTRTTLIDYAENLSESRVKPLDFLATVSAFEVRLWGYYVEKLRTRVID